MFHIQSIVPSQIAEKETLFTFTPSVENHDLFHSLLSCFLVENLVEFLHNVAAAFVSLRFGVSSSLPETHHLPSLPAAVSCETLAALIPFFTSMSMCWLVSIVFVLFFSGSTNNFIEQITQQPSQIEDYPPQAISHTNLKHRVCTVRNQKSDFAPTTSWTRSVTGYLQAFPF